MTIVEGIPALPADAAVFLDFDGTLVEIASTPDQVTVPASLVPLLRSLTDRFSRAVALVSGRPVADLDRRLAPLALPTPACTGSNDDCRTAAWIASRRRPGSPRWCPR
ncbi:MAG: trehalose-phosphatase [Pseudomonadota bacterium]